MKYRIIWIVYLMLFGCIAMAYADGYTADLCTDPTRAYSESEFGESFQDDLAFNNVIASGESRWSTSLKTGPVFTWIAYKFTSPKNISRINLMPHVSYAQLNFNNFSIQGSSDSTNGADGTWVTLVSGLNTTTSVHWYNFTFSHPDSYIWYRLAGYTRYYLPNEYYVQVDEIEMMEKLTISIESVQPLNNTEFAYGTASVNMSALTSHNATCRYSTTPGQAFGAMTLFSSTGNTTHNSTISGLQNGMIYSYYIKCNETATGEITNEYYLRFGVSSELFTANICTNISRVYSESEFSSGYLDDFAVDNNLATPWSTNIKPVSLSTWLAYSFPQSYRVTKLDLYPRPGFAHLDFKNFSILGSSDSTNGTNGAWTTIVSGLNTSNVNSIWTNFSFVNPDSYIWYKLTGYAQYQEPNQYYIQVGEMRCFAVASSGNPPIATNFTPHKDTTNFSGLSDFTSIQSLVLANAHGRIRFPAMYAVNTDSENYDLNVKIGRRFVSVNASGLHLSFNSSSNITIEDVDCSGYVLYYGSGTYASADEVKALNQPCIGTICQNITCAGTNLTFTAAHFTGYAVGTNTNLTIYDELEVSGTKYTNEAVAFYANYTNLTNGAHIAGASCNISFDDGAWSFAMSDNGVNYNYTKNSGFAASGAHTWNVTCAKSGFNTLNATDDVYITAGAVPEFSGIGFAIAIGLILGAACFYKSICKIYKKGEQVN